MNVISTNIKRLRKLHNLNQTEFANSIGVSQGSLSDIESGKSNPSVDTIVSIFKRYSCSLESLLTGKDANQRADHLVDEHKFNDLEKELINTFRQLDMKLLLYFNCLNTQLKIVMTIQVSACSTIRQINSKIMLMILTAQSFIHLFSTLKLI